MEIGETRSCQAIRIRKEICRSLREHNVNGSDVRQRLATGAVSPPVYISHSRAQGSNLSRFTIIDSVQSLHWAMKRRIVDSVLGVGDGSMRIYTPVPADLRSCSRSAGI